MASPTTYSGTLFVYPHTQLPGIPSHPTARVSHTFINRWANGALPIQVPPRVVCCQTRPQPETHRTKQNIFILYPYHFIRIGREKYVACHLSTLYIWGMKKPSFAIVLIYTHM